MVGILKNYPEYSFVLDYKDFYAAEATGIYPFTGLTLHMNACVVAVIMMLEGNVVGGFMMTHAFWMLDGHVRLSTQTRRLHVKLMKALLLQLAVPYLTLLCPWGLFTAVQFCSTVTELLLHMLKGEVLFPAFVFRCWGVACTTFGLGVKVPFGLAGLAMMSLVFAISHCVFYRHRQEFPVFSYARHANPPFWALDTGKKLAIVGLPAIYGFMTGMMILGSQIIFPTLTLWVPWAAYGFLIVFSVVIPTEINNFLFVANASHSQIASLLLAFFTDSYRNYMFHAIAPFIGFARRKKKIIHVTATAGDSSGGRPVTR
ncbi:unnamed protein product, partial [Mesorhabditis spiculigera]